jgi:D-beta-D-heptose 7-phosphate kinase / D-beta-D-heptose 1-phosphate adenosyltransferase
MNNQSLHNNTKQDYKEDLARLKEIMKQFSTKKILVVGDFCLDEYIFGDTDAISPEAPIPRVIINNKKYVPGAAGNVVCGVRALGAETLAVGVIGNDINGNVLLKELNNRGINTEGILSADERNTPTYSRIVCGGNHCPKQQLIRFDVENHEKIAYKRKQAVKDFIIKKIPMVDAIIVADYDEMNGMGIITQELCEAIVTFAKQYNKPVVGDSRCNLQLFKGFTTVIPNDIEAGKAINKKLNGHEEILQAGEQLRRDLNLKTIMITRGKDGISVFEENKHTLLPTVAREVFDVTGAGDTVTAVTTLALASGATFPEAATLANYGARITVAKEGTVAVSTLEIEETMRKRAAVEAVKKQKSREEIKNIVAKAKEQNKSIVFLNGYFDPLHIGHIHLINSAKEHGNTVIVGLNTDQSVRDNKGPERPYMNQTQRAQLLASIEAVDHLVFYNELTPIKLIQEIQPDILAKGNNYSVEEVVGKDIVESYGGKVVLLDTIQGLSSDIVLQAMKKTQ